MTRAFARLVLSLFACYSAGCTRCSDSGSQGTSDAALSGIAGAVVVASGTDPAKLLRDVLPRQIPAGQANNRIWTSAFELTQVTSDENLDWPAAMAHCAERGKSLCIETQWQRACELEPRIGGVESWTLSVEHRGVVVRGGVDGCKTRALHPIEGKAPTRIGLCCDRALALSSANVSDSLRVAATKHILELEAALQNHDREAIDKLLADKLSVDGNAVARNAFFQKHAEEWKADETRRSHFDLCSLKSDSAETDLTVIADCSVSEFVHGKLQGTMRRVVYDSSTGIVSYFGDPKAMKTKEQKERIKAFLPSGE